MKNYQIKVFILCLLICTVVCQRGGGGGGGGGGGSSGGGSSGGGGFGGGGGGGGGLTCKQECEDEHGDFNTCVRRCREDRARTTGLVLGLVFGILFGFPLLILLIVVCIKTSCCRLCSCKFWRCLNCFSCNQKYKDLKSRHNKPVKDSTRLEMFNTRLTMLNELVGQSSNENTFKFTQGSSDYWVKAESSDSKV